MVIIGHHAIQQFKHLITMDEGYYTLKNCKDEYSISVLHGHLEELARYIQKPTNNKSSHLQFLMGLFLTTVFDKVYIYIIYILYKFNIGCDMSFSSNFRQFHGIE